MKGTLSREGLGWRVFATAAATLAFLWATVLSVSPELHQRVHSDANQVQHSCAAIYIGSGQLHHSAPLVLSASYAPKIEYSEICAANPDRIACLFLSAAIFEHAPPFYS
jgi:hypothetical protein